MAEIFLDCEMTSLLHPQLLSIGLVTLDGREFYSELSLESDLGQARLAATPFGVRAGVIQGKWGLFPGATFDTDPALGQRLADWLLGLAASDTSGKVRLLYDYSLDYQLVVEVLHASEMWERIGPILEPSNVALLAKAAGPAQAGEATYRALRERAPPLHRHHALADALALRNALRMARLMLGHRPDWQRLLDIAGPLRTDWLYGWMATPASELGERVPLDVVGGSDGVNAVAEALRDRFDSALKGAAE